MKKFNFRFFLVITLAFFAFTIIGTLSHELGHIAVARMLGYKTILHYSSMHYNKTETTDEQQRYYSKYEKFIRNSDVNWKLFYLSYRFKTEYDYNKLKEELWISSGGPLQTILTGCIGLSLLFFFRKRDRNTSFAWWGSFILALFWLREPYNLFTPLAGITLRRPQYLKFALGDETKISRLFGLPDYTLIVILGTVGFLIAAYIIFRLIPKEKVLSFLAGGFTGGLIGIYIWFFLAGPYLLP